MDTVVWIVIIVVVVLLVAGLALGLARRRRQTVHREQAQELRRDAVAQATGLQDSARDTREAKLEAERARVEAERAEARATEAQQGHLQEQAHHEDRLREADRLDPDVDHRSGDYEPGTHPAPGQGQGTTESGTADPRTGATEGTTDPGTGAPGTRATTDPHSEATAAEDPVHRSPESGEEGTRRT